MTEPAVRRQERPRERLRALRGVERLRAEGVAVARQELDAISADLRELGVGLEYSFRPPVRRREPIAKGARRQRTRRPISEVIREIVGHVPAEELEKLPTDASDQIDHYLYGFPKKKR